LNHKRYFGNNNIGGDTGNTKLKMLKRIRHTKDYTTNVIIWTRKSMKKIEKKKNSKKDEILLFLHLNLCKILK